MISGSCPKRSRNCDFGHVGSSVVIGDPELRKRDEMLQANPVVFCRLGSGREYTGTKVTIACHTLTLQRMANDISTYLSYKCEKMGKYLTLPLFIIK